MLEEKHYEFLEKLCEKKDKNISQVLREIIKSHLETSRLYTLSSIAGIIEDSEFAGRDHDKWIYYKK